MELFWALLGSRLGDLGAILKLQKLIGSGKARTHKSLKVLEVFQRFWLIGIFEWIRCHLKPSCTMPLGGMLEAILSQLWRSCAILEAILGHLGRSWSHLGPKASHGCPREAETLQKQLAGLLVGCRKIASGGHLGSLLEVLGALLESPWPPLGALLGDLGAILRPQKPIRSETVRSSKQMKTH